MALGPGKYDGLCTHVREHTKADAAIVIVFGGVFGSGFSVQAPPQMTARLPELLEGIAGEIRESLKGGGA